MRLPTIKLGDFFELRTLYGRDADDWTPYMSQLIVGRLRFHVFHRGDEDPDPHDHPWDFWTFPLVAYEEEVTDPATGAVHQEIVTAFHWHHRQATYTHRVLWPLAHEEAWFGGPLAWVRIVGKPIPTIVWTGPKVRKWGFLKARDGRWCWVAWRDYIYEGGKHGPCE